MNKIVISQKCAQKFLEDGLLIPLDLLLIFCITFSGDTKVFGVPIFGIFWLIIVTLRRNFKFQKTEVLVQIFLIVFFLPILIQFYKYNFEYYFAAFSTILYVNALVFANYTLNRLLSDSPGAKVVQWLPFVLIVILGVLTQRFSGDSSRQSFLFGPNVYYRIIGAIFLLHIILFKQEYESVKAKFKLWSSMNSLLMTFISLFISLFILLKTGSRGATIVGQFLLLYFSMSILSIKQKWLKIVSIFVIVFVLALVIYTLFSTLSSDYRGFWFYDRGASSGSIKDRQGFLDNLPSFLMKDNFLFGEGSNYIYSYPHNLYLDILYNSGIFPCLILLSFTFIYVILLLKGKVTGNWKLLTIILLPIYIGSLVSGTLYDNYPIITMIIMVPIWVQKQERSTSKRKSISLEVS
ncbi:O-antigen ligase family protein [Scytonema sp. NUACC26]|uniref:O-antigen ligase family protein n=1 Tax=Scytonema sp. NUACC26 TaxID=3140176 RepID=UPI0034DC35CF